MVDDGIVALGIEAGDQAIPLAFDESGKLVGFDVEIGEAIAAKLGVKAE
ncbi:transporter substrate-binding domain-containing protein, partial [Rhizobium leguminosarum]